MLGTTDLSDKSFLDIGCGSGLHSLAALKMGAARVLAIDVDPTSVKTTHNLIEKFKLKDITVSEMSVFDLRPEAYGHFDIVYSWGVLHHTGDMVRAINVSSKMVRSGGLLAIALYGRTRFCAQWKRIKCWYVNASPKEKAWAERMYVRLFRAYLALRGKRLSTHIRNYSSKRGMDFLHDVRDWIGGYPYESIRGSELEALLQPAGFVRVSATIKRRSGLFGSGCDEFTYRLSGSRAKGPN
jgi:2-polyprenyl-6-hydroxyphenyl methylase/3-demethylubiquinone-9 3-methyltransferase